MKTYYHDLLALAPYPLWFDENGVPRFSAFEPGMQAGFYANEVCLMEIACQSCKKIFHVAVSRDRHSKQMNIDYSIRQGSLQYGDPPNVGCCDAGPSEMSTPIRVLEYWYKDPQYKWARNPALEIEFEKEYDEI